MNYAQGTLGLKYGLLIDLDCKCSLNFENCERNNPFENLVEIAAGETLWQCDEYFIPNNFFGPLPPDTAIDLTKINLVMRSEPVFSYLSRRIIIENVIMDLFLSLGRKVHKNNTIFDGTKYLTLFSEYGYFQMTKILDKNGKISKEITNKRNEEIHNLTSAFSEDKYTAYKSKQKNRIDQIKKFLQNDYIQLCTENNTTFKECYNIIKNHRGKENIQLPAFDCKLLSRIIRQTKIPNLIYSIITTNDKKIKLQKTNELRTFISKLESICDEDTPLELYTLGNTEEHMSKLQSLDNNIYRYCIEKYFHVELQHQVLSVCKKLSREYGLEATHIQNALLDSVNMNLQFGMDYILNYPLKYIHSPYIKLDTQNLTNNNSAFYVNVNEAERIWINKYNEYLSTLSYVTVPIARTAFELNLYGHCEELLQKQYASNTQITETQVHKKMYEILEEYVKNNSNYINYNYLDNTKLYNSAKQYREKYLLNGNINAYIKNFMDLKNIDTYFSEKPVPSLEKIDKKNEQEQNFIMRLVSIWYNPENFEHFWNKTINENYYDTRNEIGMQFFEKKIISARRDSIIAKHSQKWTHINNT